MGKRLFQNTSNSIKTNMAPPNPSGLTTRRPEHPNPEETEENDLPYNFIKMTEILKEEMKNSLKEMDEETNKNWKKSLNLLKKPKKEQSKR